MGALTPTPDLAQNRPDPGKDSSIKTAQHRPGSGSGEGELAPIVVTRKQREEVLKTDFEKLKQDAAELTALAQSLQEDLEKYVKAFEDFRKEYEASQRRLYASEAKETI